MKLSFYGNPPPSPTRNLHEPEPSTESNSSANNYRTLGHNAVLDTATGEILGAVPMQRSSRRPQWANMATSSNFASTGAQGAGNTPVASQKDTAYWLKPNWNVNGIIIPVRVMSDTVDMTKDGARQALASLSLLSPNLLNKLVNDGFTFAAVNRSMVEFDPALKGKKAGGNRATWDHIPCGHVHDKKVVVFSAEGNHTGCYDSLLHEIFHAIDDTDESLLSGKKEFEDAYNADKPKIIAAYYLQTGDRGTNGKQETFAEVGARYLAGDPALEKELLNLYKYFDDRYQADKKFAETQKGAAQFRPTSAIYADRGGYKSLTRNSTNNPVNNSTSTGTALSIEEYLASLRVE